MIIEDEPRWWRSVGPWMAAAGAALMFVNAARAFADPTAFAAYLGLPLAAAADVGLVHVYSLRALFIGLLVAGLLATRQRSALVLLAGAAVVMPVGDALLTASAGAPTSTIVRHLLIAAFLLATALVLRRGQPKRAA